MLGHILQINCDSWTLQVCYPLDSNRCELFLEILLIFAIHLINLCLNFYQATKYFTFIIVLLQFVAKLLS